MWITPPYDTSKLTLELRDVVNSGVDIWDFDYPSYYKGDDKKAFEQKVIDHYYFRQIGSETVGRFKHQFKTRIREIMPRYIDMYKTVEIMHDLPNPFDNVDFTETIEETRTGTETGTASGTASGTTKDTATGSESRSESGSKSTSTDGTRKHSDTPQGAIENIETYMSDATKENATGSESSESGSEGSTNAETNSQANSESSSESNVQKSETFTQTHTKKGNQGVNTYAHDMIEFRQSIIDVDMMIINDLNDLFLGIY